MNNTDPMRIILHSEIFKPINNWDINYNIPIVKKIVLGFIFNNNK